MKNRFLIITALILLSVSCKEKKVEDNNFDSYLVVGTYTTAVEEGINVYKLNTETGESQFVSTKKGVENPSYVTISKDGNFVYAVSENKLETASVSAFKFNKNKGELSLLNSQKTKGADPCHLAIDNSGRNLVVANYSGASLINFPIKEDGSLDNNNGFMGFVGKGIDSVRQTQPHIHYVYFTPDNKYLLVNDLGLDKIYRFNLKTESPSYLDDQPSIFTVKDTYGPRHLDFHPNNKWIYLLGELSGEVAVFDYNDGELKEKQSIIADTLQVKGSGDIHVSPNGKFVYASNRLEGDGIAIFEVNQTDGTLTKVAYQETGMHPRNFVITDNGKLLLVANRDSNNIQVFSINQESGLLTNLNKDINMSKPVCLKLTGIK